MTVSWPLLAYTLCSLVACGTLGVQGAVALRGHGTKLQAPAVAAALAFALAGGVFACMRFGHLERLFNVFANPASPIAQGYYAVVLVAAVALVALVVLRRGEVGEGMPRWCAALTVAGGLAGVYALAANDTATIRDAGKTWLTAAYFLCAATLAGTLVCSGIQALRERAALRGLGAAGVAAALANGAMGVAYAFVSPTLGVRAASITSSTYGIVPGSPSGSSASDAAALVGFDSPVFWVGVVAVGIVVPIVGSLAARRLRGGAAGAVCAVAAACALVGVACALELFLPSGSGTRFFA